MNDETHGILLVGHGTRDAQGQAEFRQVAAMLRKQLPGTMIADCFLELAEPDIATGVDTLVQAGVRNIVAAPLLLFAAGHAKRDIPEAIEEAVRQYDGVRWRMAEPLGDHPEVLKLAAQRFATAWQRIGEPQGDVTLVIAARGSSDTEAIANVHAFVDAHCAGLCGIAARQVGFLAAATPTLDETFQWACRQGPPEIIVQPHLLFHGQLIQDIAGKVAAIASCPPGEGKRWQIARHLGPSPEIVAALLTRLQEVAPW